MPRRILEVVAATVIGVALMLVVLSLLTNDSSDDAPDDTVPTVAEANNPVDPELFLADYSASLTGTYVATGTQTVSDDNIEIAVSTFKHVQRNEQSFQQEGSSILLIDGTIQQLCERDPLSEETTCSPNQTGPTTAERVDEFRQRLVPQGDAERADYEVYRGEPGCWQTIGTRPLPNSAWGQTTKWCFDASTGALIRRETITGSERVLVEATLVLDEVSDTDFKPDDA